MEKINLNILTHEQTRQLVREELESFFSQNPITIDAGPQEPKVVDLNGLLKARPFIGSRSTLYKKIALGLIPHSKQGKKLYFNLESIDQWLLENRTKSPGEIEAETEKYIQKLNKKRR